MSDSTENEIIDESDRRIADRRRQFLKVSDDLLWPELASVRALMSITKMIVLACGIIMFYLAFWPNFFEGVNFVVGGVLLFIAQGLNETSRRLREFKESHSVVDLRRFFESLKQLWISICVAVVGATAYYALIGIESLL